MTPPTLDSRPPAFAALRRLGRRELAAGAILLLLACNLAGAVDPLVDFLGRGYVARSNDAYLEEAGGRAVETFLILSALKAGLSVLQSSEAGISLVVQMRVQVGKVIESLSDTVDAGWKISLLSLTALAGTRILLRLASAASGPLLSLSLAALLAYFLMPLAWRKARRAAWSAGGSLLVFTIAAQVLLPVSVFLGSAVSARITAPLAEESKLQIQSVHDELSGGEPAPADVRGHLERALERFKSLSRQIGEKLSLLGRHVAQRIAVTVFDVFVFPLLFLLPSAFLVRTAVGHLFERPPEEALPPPAEKQPQTAATR